MLKAKIHSNLASNVNQQIGTVGIRMPNNLTAIKILQAVGRPLVGTSANISNAEEATNAYEVLRDFEGQIDLLVDQGEVEIGIPSTIVDLTTDQVKILREGAIPRAKIEEILGVKTL